MNIIPALQELTQTFPAAKVSVTFCDTHYTNICSVVLIVEIKDKQKLHAFTASKGNVNLDLLLKDEVSAFIRHIKKELV